MPLPNINDTVEEMRNTVSVLSKGLLKYELMRPTLWKSQKYKR